MPSYVNESSALTVRARFYNQSNDPTVPLSIRYLIKDISNDRVVHDWIDLTPAESVNIEIAASENNMYEHTPSSRRFEKRVVTVQANAGQITQFTNEIEYWVRNLAGIEND